jgi:hypothetical protein
LSILFKIFAILVSYQQQQANIKTCEINYTFWFFIVWYPQFFIVIYAKNDRRKKAILDSLSDKLNKAKSVVFVNFQGLYS